MGKKAINIILLLIPALLVGTSSCITINQPPASESSQPEQSSSLPEYQINSFILEGEEEYSFTIYLRSDETLHLFWTVEYEQTPVWFHILTPSGQSVGFYGDEGNYADGTLCDYATQGMTAGITQFSPRQYDWGEGYYKMMLNKYSENSVEVKVEYWIED